MPTKSTFKRHCWHSSVNERQLKCVREALVVICVAMADSVASSLTTQSPNAKVVIVNIDNMPSNERVPASIRDELRRTVALYCMDIIYKKDPMKVNAMRQLMHDLYHGNQTKRTISHVKLLCAGEEMFESMFEEKIENVVGRSAQGTAVKHLKSIY